jgi:hypothetical protein
MILRIGFILRTAFNLEWARVSRTSRPQTSDAGNLGPYLPAAIDNSGRKKQRSRMPKVVARNAVYGSNQSAQDRYRVTDVCVAREMELANQTGKGSTR